MDDHTRSAAGYDNVRDRGGAQDGLNREIERDMEHEPAALRPETAEEPEIIGDVLENVQAKDQIERGRVRFEKVPEMKGEAAILARAAERDGLR